MVIFVQLLKIGTILVEYTGMRQLMHITLLMVPFCLMPMDDHKGKTNFPFFRGEKSLGIAGGKGYPVVWDGEKGVNIIWKTEIRGNGKSSPVIWGNKLFVTGARGPECEVYCLDKKTGKLLWTGSASGMEGEPEEVPEMDHESGMAVSTAAVSKDYVCAVFANGNVVCFDHSGNRRWGFNINPPENVYGYTASPVIFEDLLIIQYDSDKKVSLMGIDLGTGQIRWEVKRRGGIVWSSPVIAEFNGAVQVILNGNPFVSSFDPHNGKELWAVECMTGDVAPSVAANSHFVYAVTDYARLVAIKPGTEPIIEWQDNMFTPDVSSPVATDELLFLATGNGDVACYNASIGDTLWTKFFYTQFYASPIIADGKVWLLDRGGTMHVFSASGEFNLISESPLGEPADCTPAFSDKKIYIRGRENIYCIGNK